MIDHVLIAVLLPLLAPWIGSFLGVVVLRLPRGEDWVVGRSRCDGCGATIPPWHLLPLLSFVLLRGRAACCGVAMSPFYPGIECAALAIALLALGILPDPATAWVGAGLGWALLVLGWIDARCFTLPDVLTLPLLLAGLANVLLADVAALPAHALAAMLGYAAFRLVAMLYKALRGREGLGQGDAKLLAAGGAWIGPAGLHHVILLGSLLGICMALGLAALHRDRRVASVRLPFGPALAIAIWVVWLAAAAPGQHFPWAP